MANPTVLQNALWGKETTPGTPPASVTKYLGGLSVSFAPQGGDAEPFRPEGSKFATFVVPSGTEYTQINLSGTPTYNELAYLFCGLFKTVTPTGTTAKTWAFSPSYNAVDTRTTYTIDRGTTSRAERVSYASMTGLSLTFRRQNIEMSGTMIGYAVSDTAGISGSPSAVALKPLLGKDVTFYLEDAQTKLASATAQTSIFQVELNFTDTQGPVWIPKKAQTGFKELVDYAPTFSGSLSIEKNADGEALRAEMRSGTQKWLRIKVVDDTEIETGVPYSLTMDMPIYLTNPGDQQDQDGVFALGFNFTGSYDATWAKAIEVTLVNTVSTL